TKVALDPVNQDFFEYARIIMSKQEKDIFNHLPDPESRKAFREDFWEKRDPDPDTDINEFQEEFYRRIDYANERFIEGIPGWKTDRGRIFIYFGEPEQTQMNPMLNSNDAQIAQYHGYILWQYYQYGFAIMFVDKRGDSVYTFDPVIGVLGEGGGIVGDFFTAVDRAQFGLPPRTRGFKEKFLDFGFKFDRESKEFNLSIPTETVTFVSEEGLLKADFDIEFDFYRKKSTEKLQFKESRHFEKSEDETVQLKDIKFLFSFPDLSPGKYYVDVVILGGSDNGKARKIFEINF
ncbi:MAG: GWxTD domain-containing protein, partial [Candidatus Aminicenantes bacterium]|nr:GWxTD domain-containing protein [Candidatus Aminicenantes bacterium]